MHKVHISAVSRRYVHFRHGDASLGLGPEHYLREQKRAQRARFCAKAQKRASPGSVGLGSDPGKEVARCGALAPHLRQRRRCVLRGIKAYSAVSHRKAADMCTKCTYLLHSAADMYTSVRVGLVAGFPPTTGLTCALAHVNPGFHPG